MTVKHAFSALTTEWDSLKDTHTYVKWLLCAESLVALYTEIVWREQIKNKKQKQWLNVNDNQQYWRRCGDMHLTFKHLLLHCIRQISRLIEWLQITITEEKKKFEIIIKNAYLALGGPSGGLLWTFMVSVLWQCKQISGLFQASYRSRCLQVGVDLQLIRFQIVW